MNLHTLPSNEQHQQIMLLLPWYLNQSLNIAERRRVEKHLHSCLVCALELSALRKLASALEHSSDMQVAAEASFAGMQAKMRSAQSMGKELTNVKMNVDANKKSVVTVKRSRQFLRSSVSSIVGFAIAASLLIMIPLTTKVFTSPVPADYFTLSATKPEAPVGAKLRVVFSKNLSESGINSLLAQIHGQRIGGPNTVGAYMVGLSSGDDSPDLNTALSLLRNQQEVMLAEPVMQP